MYYVITSSEDGLNVQPMNERELKAYLSDLADERDAPVFSKTIPEIDKGNWFHADDNTIVIIKGEIMVPKPKTVVKEWEV